jgi:adenylate cyclase
VKLEQARIAAKPATSLQAYDLVLRGRELEGRQQRASNIAARAMFERAAALDPMSAAANIGLGEVELTAANWGWREDPIAAAKSAEDFARSFWRVEPRKGTLLASGAAQRSPNYPR